MGKPKLCNASGYHVCEKTLVDSFRSRTERRGAEGGDGADGEGEDVSYKEVYTKVDNLDMRTRAINYQQYQPLQQLRGLLSR